MAYKIEIGKTYLFNYPNFGTPDGLPEYTEHSGQHVVVSGRTETENGPLYHVVAGDGWKGDVWAEELIEIF